MISPHQPSLTTYQWYTVQVQDLDFKLMKPMTQLQVMSSEDLFASNGQGHISTGMSHLQAILIIELLISNSFFQVRLAL